MKMKPLQNIRVLDLTRAAAGPYATMMLGDMGADVIKLEFPKVGDDLRYYGPPFVGGESYYFMILNRNKRSITLNLKHEQGKQILRDMIPHIDVLIENFSPGTMEKLELGYESLRSINPKLIYCAISGFGSTGPDATRRGYDLIAQGMGGIMSVTGEVGGRPLRVGVAQADYTTGMFAAFGILVALYHRKNTGEGQRLETSLFESQIALLAFQAGRYFASGQNPEPIGNTHPVIAPFESFETRDGYINIAIGNNNLWSKFCRVMKLEAYESDPRFESNPARVQNRPAMVEFIEEKTKKLTRQEIGEILDKAGIPNGPVWEISDVVDSPQAIARQMTPEMDHPAGGKIRVTGIPVKLECSPGEIKRPAPLLGEHTEEVLKEILGMKSEEIEQLRKQDIL
jgi:CoA:oxalate CoA-transferase